MKRDDNAGVAKERPILFSGEMVRAILDGRKTQTRRAVKLSHERGMQNPVVKGKGGEVANVKFAAVAGLCPYGQPGDRLWVRESFTDLRGTGIEHRPDTTKDRVQRYAYAADTPAGSMGDEARKEFGIKWKPSIHMPRLASRILLEVVSVRVERLSDISNEDAKAEGAEIWWQGLCADARHPCRTATGMFRELWESINGAGSWDENPWVWVVEFKRIDQQETAA